VSVFIRFGLLEARNHHCRTTRAHVPPERQAVRKCVLSVRLSAGSLATRGRHMGGLQPHANEVLGRNSVSVLGHLLDQLRHFHSVVHL
jgi:hypothetical protein